MGRPRKNTIAENIEEQIEKAQTKVIKTKAAYGNSGSWITKTA